MKKSCSTGEGNQAGVKATIHSLASSGDSVSTGHVQHPPPSPEPELPFLSNLQSCPPRKLLEGRWNLGLRGSRAMRSGEDHKEGLTARCVTSSLSRTLMPTSPQPPASSCGGGKGTKQEGGTHLRTLKVITSSQYRGSTASGGDMVRVRHAKVLNCKQTDSTSGCPEGHRATASSGPGTKRPVDCSCLPFSLSLKATPANTHLQPITADRVARPKGEHSRCEQPSPSASFDKENQPSTPHSAGVLHRGEASLSVREDTTLVKMKVNPDLPASSSLRALSHSSTSPAITSSVLNQPTSIKDFLARLQPRNPPSRSSPCEFSELSHCRSQPTDIFEGFSPLQTASFRPHETPKQKENQHSLPHASNTVAPSTPAARVQRAFLSPVSDSAPHTVPVTPLAGDPSRLRFTHQHNSMVSDAIVPSLARGNIPVRGAGEPVSPLQLHGRLATPEGHPGKSTRLCSSMVIQDVLSRKTTLAKLSKSNTTPAAPSKSNITPAAPSKSNTTPAAPSKSKTMPAAPSKSNTTPAAPSKSNTTAAVPSKSNTTAAGHPRHSITPAGLSESTASDLPRNPTPVGPSKNMDTPGLSSKQVALVKSLDPWMGGEASKPSMSPGQHPQELRVTGTSVKFVVQHRRERPADPTLLFKRSADPNTSGKSSVKPVTSSVNLTMSGSTSEDCAVITMPILEPVVPVEWSTRAEVPSMPSLEPVTPTKPSGKPETQCTTTTQDPKGFTTAELVKECGGEAADPQISPKSPSADKTNSATLNDPKRKVFQSGHTPDVPVPVVVPKVEQQETEVAVTSKPLTVATSPPASSASDKLYPVMHSPPQTALAHPYRTKLHMASLGLLPGLRERILGVRKGEDVDNLVKQQHLNSGSHKLLPDMKGQERASRTQPRGTTADTKLLQQGTSPSPGTHGHKAALQERCESTKEAPRAEKKVNEVQPLARKRKHSNCSDTAGLESQPAPHHAAPYQHKSAQGRKRTSKPRAVRKGAERKKSQHSHNESLPVNAREQLRAAGSEKDKQLPTDNPPALMAAVGGASTTLPSSTNKLRQSRRLCKWLAEQAILDQVLSPIPQRHCSSKESSTLRGSRKVCRSEGEHFPQPKGQDAGGGVKEAEEKVGRNTSHLESPALERKVTPTQSIPTTPKTPEKTRLKASVDECHRRVVLSPQVVIVRVNNRVIKNAFKKAEETKIKKANARKTGKKRSQDVKKPKRVRNDKKECTPPTSRPSNTPVSNPEAAQGKAVSVPGDKSKEHALDNEGIFISQKIESPYPVVAQSSLELNFKQRGGTSMVDTLYKKLHLDQDTDDMEFTTPSSSPPPPRPPPPLPTLPRDLGNPTPGDIMTFLPHLSQALKSLPMSRSKLTKPKRLRKTLHPDAASCLSPPVKHLDKDTSGDTAAKRHNTATESDGEAALLNDNLQPSSRQVVSTEKDVELEDFDLREKTVTHRGVKRRKGRRKEYAQRDELLNEEVSQGRRVNGKLNQQVEKTVNEEPIQDEGTVDKELNQQVEEMSDGELNQHEEIACPRMQKETGGTSKDPQDNQHHSMTKRTRKRRTSLSGDTQDEEPITQKDKKPPAQRGRKRQLKRRNTRNTPMQPPMTHTHTASLHAHHTPANMCTDFTTPRIHTQPYTNPTYTNPIYTLMNGPHMYASSPCSRVNPLYTYMNTPYIPHVPMNTPKLHMNATYAHMSTPCMHTYPINHRCTLADLTYTHMNTWNTHPVQAHKTTRTYTNSTDTYTKTPKVCTDAKRTHSSPSIHTTPSCTQAKVNKYKFHSYCLMRARLHTTNT